MGAVMRRLHAVGLPWRRGDQWGATSAALAGQEHAAAAFERTARSRHRASDVREAPKKTKLISRKNSRILFTSKNQVHRYEHFRQIQSFGGRTQVV